MEDISKLEKLVSMRIIQEDAESLYSLLCTERDPIFSMAIIPYCALFIQSYQEFIGDTFLPESIASKIKEIRDHIKVFSVGYGKSKKRVVAINDRHNQEFKSRLRFNILKKWNIHFNLGTYWTEDNRIIGNTQLLADFLGIESLNSNANKRQYELAYQIGSFISAVREGFSEAMDSPCIKRKNESISIKYYYDLNTNKNNTLFCDHSQKELNLFYLHLLCNMNFVKLVLRELFEEGNTWIFRVEYIVTYYALRALQRVMNYCDNNSDTTVETGEIKRLSELGKPLFQTQFRNCMMHYGLEGEGVIMPENCEKHFYGIVENCFDGKDYYIYLSELRNFSDEIIAFLEKHFDFSNVTLQKR